ncbi:MAG: ATP-binding protein, partial [bacterium]
GTVEDITDRVRREEEHKRLEKQLHQSQKMESVGQLAGGIAHDFNNILTIISGYSQLLLERLDQNTPLRKNVEKIMKAGEQAASLTRQLLAFSRKQALAPKVLDLNATLADVKKMLGRFIGEDIKMDTVLEPDLMHVKVDPGQIEQVIMNLVVNARDAMPDGGKITVRTENVDIDKELSKVIPEALPGRFVRFSVEDAGVGIDKAILDQIFEPFFTTKDVGVGTGLGLSVVYGIIKQHDGWINVYSEPGQGTIFKVYLPAVSAEIDDITKDTISLKELKGSGERILLAEDEEGTRGFAAEALRENGYIIFEAANAKEAHDLFINENGNFDLVFSDVVMPGKSGLELIDELISGKPDLQVLLCSGYSDKKSQWHEIKKRGFRFLQKPYAVSDLLKIIREVISAE